MNDEFYAMTSCTNSSIHDPYMAILHLHWERRYLNYYCWILMQRVLHLFLHWLRELFWEYTQVADLGLVISMAKKNALKLGRLNNHQRLCNSETGY